uniref:Uncharacterized protein n=1 Tax=Staphylothermus marinus TaxID=2280 RepID=A0A7C4DBX5_STAMA
MVKTIEVEDGTYESLIMVLDEMSAKYGKRLTFDEVIRILIDIWLKSGKKVELRIPTDNVATKDEGGVGGEGGVGPFIAGLYSSILRNAEAAEEILREEGDRLTPEQKAYYMHMIREGEKARKFLEKYGIPYKPLKQVLKEWREEKERRESMKKN